MPRSAQSSSDPPYRPVNGSLSQTQALGYCRQEQLSFQFPVWLPLLGPQRNCDGHTSRSTTGKGGRQMGHGDDADRNSK